MSKISEWRELLKPIIIEQIDSLRMDYRLLENSILAEKESISKMKRTFLLIKEDGDYKVTVKGYRAKGSVSFIKS